MRALICRFDSLLRLARGIFDCCDSEHCLLRLQVARAPHSLRFDNRVVEAGESVLLLHLWNEHIPPLPLAGPDLGWASQTRRLLLRSFCAAARQMRHNPHLAGVQAVGGVTAFLSPLEHPGGTYFMQRLGFSVLPNHSRLGRFGEFWENFYSWGIMWTFNAVSLRHRRLGRMCRSEVWMPADEFILRYGTSE